MRIPFNRKPLMTAVFSASFAVPVLAQSPSEQTDLSQEELKQQNFEEVVVTGSSIRGIESTGSNTISLDRDLIDSTAISNTSDLLALIPQVGGFQTVPQGALGFAGVAVAPTLRDIGLGGSSTLTLLNGRRMVGAGILQTVAEPSVIPPLALQSVEVIADGASAIYGSDAVVGVINLQTRRDFDGVEVNFRYGSADSYSDMNAGFLAGKQWENGSAIIAYEYEHRDSLSGSDRDFITSDFRSRGGIDDRSTSCAQANVLLGALGTAAAPTFIPGTANRCDLTNVTEYIPEDDRHSLFVSVQHDISDRVELYGEFYHSERETRKKDPQEAFIGIIPATSPAFPVVFTGLPAVGVSYRFDNEFGDHAIDETEMSSSGAIVGFKANLGSDWQLDTYLNIGSGTSKVVEPGIDQNAATIAFLAGFDPFNSSNPLNEAFLDSIGNFVSVAEADQELMVFNAKADGPLFETGAGSASLAVGIEARVEELESSLVKGSTFNNQAKGDRKVESLFAELYVPLIDEASNIPLVQALNLSLAGRYDEYEDVGSTSNPKVGVVWDLNDELSLSAVWGTSFHAPGLADSAVAVDGRLQVVQVLPAAFTPPGSGDLSAAFIAGGNPDLVPEEATTSTFTVEYRPNWLEGFSANLTYYDIEFENGLGVPFNFTGRLYSIPAFSQFFTLNPTAADIQAVLADLPLDGALPANLGILIDARRQNLETQTQTGLDFAINQSLDAFGGSLVLTAAGNKVFTSDLQAAPGEAFSSSKENLIDFKARLSAMWTNGQYTTASHIYHTGSSTNVTVLPREALDSFTSLAFSVSYEYQGNDMFDGISTTLTIDNALDQEPPLSRSVDGFRNGSPLGRKISLGLSKSW